MNVFEIVTDSLTYNGIAAITVPSRMDASWAIGAYEKLLSGYNFASGADRSVALACLVSAVFRQNRIQAVFVFADAGSGAAGQGLVEIASTIATGVPQGGFHVALQDVPYVLAGRPRGLLCATTQGSTCGPVAAEDLPGRSLVSQVFQVSDTGAVAWAVAHRQELIDAAATLMRAFAGAGSPRASRTSTWAIRDALVWCGRADPGEVVGP